MEKKILFPRTTVAGVDMPRMIAGTNWILGFSHTSSSADELIKMRNYNRDAIVKILEAYDAYGINAVMGPYGDNPILGDAVHAAEDKFGHGFIIVDTPIVNVDDNAKARQEAEARFKQSRDIGAKFCLIHHYSAEQLVNKNKQEMPRLPDYLKMIRDNGMIPGLSAHMPELIVYSDQNEYDVQTYIQIYNCMGFMMQVEIETVGRIFWEAKKPVMTIKPMAAGRCTPYVGLNFSWSAIRDCDMVTVGAFTEAEAREDIEISRAVFEHRYPRIGARQSPNQKQDAFGKR